MRAIASGVDSFLNSLKRDRVTELISLRNMFNATEVSYMSSVL